MKKDQNPSLAQFNLIEFSEIWLKNSGFNRIDPELKLNEDSNELVVTQSEFNKFEDNKEIIRPQTFKVLLASFSKEDETYQLEELQAVHLLTKETRICLKGTILEGKSP